MLLNLELLGLGTALAMDFEGSSFIEGLKPVQPRQGEQALWKADLTPYEHALPAMPELLPMPPGSITIRARPTWAWTVAITRSTPVPRPTASTCNTRTTLTPMRRWSITMARAPGSMSSNNPGSGANRSCFPG
ncbi:hypothetical protein QNM99_21550 [Pseudomonas sp. PCH446]